MVKSLIKGGIRRGADTGAEYLESSSLKQFNPKTGKRDNPSGLKGIGAKILREISKKR